MKKTTLLLTFTLLSICAIAQNFTALYTFDSVKTTSGITDPTPLPTATGVVFGNFKAAGTPANPNSGIRFSFTDWTAGATTGNNNYASLTGVVDTSEYYSVTISPTSGYSISLTDLTFKVQRSGTGVRTYAVRSSINNFAANIAATINPANAKLSVQAGNVFFINNDSTTSGQNSSTITLGGINFTTLVSPITFHFYAWNSEGVTGTFSIDNVTINGSAATITSITEKIKNNAQVFPNPSSDGLFKIKTNAAAKETVVSIYNSLGQLVFIKELNSSITEELNLTSQPNGCYFVTINNGIELKSEKLLINR